MPVTYLKKSIKSEGTDSGSVADSVKSILDSIELGREECALKYRREFDKYDGNVVLSREEIEIASRVVPQKLKDDIK